MVSSPRLHWPVSVFGAPLPGAGTRPCFRLRAPGAEPATPWVGDLGCTDPSGTPDHGLHAHKPRLNSQESDAAAHVAAVRGGPSYLSGPWNAVTGVMCPQAGPRRKPGCPQPTAVGPSLAGAGRFETAPPGNGSVVDRRGGHGHRHPARRADLILCDALQRAPDSRNQPGCASSSAVPSDSGLHAWSC